MVELNFENDRFGEILEFGAFGVQSIFYPASFFIYIKGAIGFSHMLLNQFLHSN